MPIKYQANFSELNRKCPTDYYERLRTPGCLTTSKPFTPFAKGPTQPLNQSAAAQPNVINPMPQMGRPIRFVQPTQGQSTLMSEFNNYVDKRDRYKIPASLLHELLSLAIYNAAVQFPEDNEQ